MRKDANTPSWRQLKQRIATHDQKTLVALVGELFDLSKSHQDFLGARYAEEDTGPALKRYKDVVSEAIYPDLIYDRNARIDFARARKAVSDFKRASRDPVQILDLMIHYVEIGTRLANDIGIDYESFYTSLESMFESVIRMLKGKEKAYAEHFLPRLKKTVKRATDAWGYRDSLEDLLDELTGSEGRA